MGSPTRAGAVGAEDDLGAAAQRPTDTQIQNTSQTWQIQKTLTSSGRRRTECHKSQAFQGHTGSFSTVLIATNRCTSTFVGTGSTRSSGWRP